MNFYTGRQQKGLTCVTSTILGWNSTATAEGIEGQAVKKAYERFLKDFFIPISRENIPIFRFSRLKERWERETAFKSSISEIAIHPDYQQIIGMGTTVIPFILQAMNEKPGQWFWALKSITGEDPVPPENRGDIKAMTQSWIKWGKEHDYIY